MPNSICPICTIDITDQGSATDLHDELLSHLVDDHELYADDAIKLMAWMVQ